MKTKKKQTNHRRTTPKRSAESQNTTQAFVEHVQELRRRLYYVAASVLVWSAAAYGIQQYIVKALLKPAHGEKFIYTSPGGGIDFLFRICLYTAFIISLPVVVYNVLRFIEPLITKTSQRFIVLGSLCSGILAIGGVAFGYFLGLPAALHFLLHQFTTVQIQPLVTIQSYLGFVIVYMVGSAMLFQLPLLLLFINRIKPLQPKRLLHYERWVVLAAFVIAGLMNPSPNVVSQLLVAGPFIIMYQIGIIMIAIINRSKKRRPVATFQPVAAVNALPVAAGVPFFAAPAPPPISASQSRTASKPFSDFIKTTNSVQLSPKLPQLPPAPSQPKINRQELQSMRRVERSINETLPYTRPYTRRTLPPVDTWRRNAI